MDFRDDGKEGEKRRIKERKKERKIERERERKEEVKIWFDKVVNAIHGKKSVNKFSFAMDVKEKKKLPQKYI